mmetsp:Transcript_9824/g.10583  ORF Transcript_9824/g.10583 Transcript_9824/m.10583 type:complete len:354 (+) Transcript_9824:81-1142(+)|eukprot:CAMPEP_0173138192 /NCGR_PEP_ID=MMETSP1105-20130129/3545_1 /TAXON_ID=2985 /ORGANISM="Ochromonas sp., Strain BG-1" /LENGTH=353 /DNA_ID=CAMNT_0014050743 /DNA_START=2169 /DNA_END=3233 /DNA_ORIENTATION=-
MRFFLIFALLVAAILFACAERWSVEKAQVWQKKRGYKAGSNFVPSTADNELEMFQDITWDPTTIDRELQWAQDAGFTTMRVFLHNILWDQGSDAFLNRLDEYLTIADKHGISTMLVLFDSCWNIVAKPGVQPEPIPGVHNSQWVQAPGNGVVYDSDAFQTLKPYVQGVVSRFKDDSRVLAWDVWNEPDNSGYSGDLIGPLLQNVFDWVREVNPSQPLTTPVWYGFSDWNTFQRIQMDNSDVISFHHYDNENALQDVISSLQDYAQGRPLICTEYMARTAGSHFEPHLQIMKDAGIYAINWGLVSGRTQTIYPWSTTTVPATEEPEIWFHDIFRNTGTAFNQSEISYIQSVLKK